MKDVISTMELYNEIDALKLKLYGILNNHQLSSDEVLKVSQKLDSLMVKYYCDFYQLAV